MSEIEKLNMIAEWQEQYKQLIEDLDNSKKRIAELEEKLANADYQLEGRDNEIAELKKSCDETQELLDKQIEATFKLDKENAELKEDLETQKRINREMISPALDRVIKQLTKAKELLAKWVELFKPKSETALPTPIQVDTEQFLKESEVEK